MNPWRAVKGVRPDTSALEVFVRFRNGLESKAAYKVATTRWTDLGDPWDVVAYRLPDDHSENDDGAWRAVSGGY